MILLSSYVTVLHTSLKNTENDSLFIEWLDAIIPSTRSFETAITNDIINEDGFTETIGYLPHLLQLYIFS